MGFYRSALLRAGAGVQGPRQGEAGRSAHGEANAECHESMG